MKEDLASEKDGRAQTRFIFIDDAAEEDNEYIEKRKNLLPLMMITILWR